MNEESLVADLLAWYKRERRELPWRDHPDPYAIWVAEIMLQQTRVETVIPYFERWMARFPTISVLARADQQDVLSAWEGLGYYSRARNLHRAAQLIVERYGGNLPSDPKALRDLPGIGRYTAGAIASFAFGLDEPALDGNIRRVLARCFDLRQPVRSPAGEKLLWELVTNLLPQGQAGDFNQAFMDLGATVCTPRCPNCIQCPLAEHCRAYAGGLQEERPVSPARPKIPHYTVTAAILHNEDRYLIAQRPQNGLLGGMWEFPGGKQQPGEDLVSCLQREIYEELGIKVEIGQLFGVYHHAYTHFRVTLHAFCCAMVDSAPLRAMQVQDFCWVKREELMNFPMGKIDRLIAAQLIREHG